MIGRLASALCLCGFVLSVCGPAMAQQAIISVAMIKQDQADCTNSQVKDDSSVTSGGLVWLVQNKDGSTDVKVTISASPQTTYNLYLKCNRGLAVIKTDERGMGEAKFKIPAGGAPKVFAFDMYPSNAPPGDKYQSMQIKLP